MKLSSRTEIICTLLKIARDDDISRAKFKILYKPFLGYAQLQYLKVMTDNDLLQYEPKTQRYKITEKGFRFLEIYNEARNVLKEQSFLLRENES
jgi:predicted transcriptional regulator